MLEKLEQKILEQRRQIDGRNETLLSLQKNFETLGNLCKQERQKNQDLKNQLHKVTSRNEHLTQENRQQNKR